MRQISNQGEYLKSLSSVAADPPLDRALSFARLGSR
jgi:hypothetical protein